MTASTLCFNQLKCDMHVHLLDNLLDDRRRTFEHAACAHPFIDIQVVADEQEAVRNLNEAQATLDDIHKAVAAQEAAQAAAEALHSWPADARLVPSTHPKHPVAQPQLLHADIATLGSYLSSLPGGISAQTDNATATDADLAADGYGASTSAHHAVEAEGGRKGSSSQGDDADVDGIDARQQRTDKTKPNGDGSGAGPNADLMASGWQRRLQTVLPKQQIHQVALPLLPTLSMLWSCH